MTIIGIDLGTSNSAAAVLRGERAVMIPSAEGVSLGGKAFPSFVAVTSEGEILVGEPARRQAAANPAGTAAAFKRQMGRRENIHLLDREFSPEQLSALLLQKIRTDAEAFLGEPTERAVVTVPAYFDDSQRNATKDACAIAGIQVERLVNEPTAASLAYGLDRLGEELVIAVVDFGGGTLDVTVMEFGQGVFEVRATSGDTQLGGTDMDQVILDRLADRFRDETGVDLREEPKARARLAEASEIAKIELSARSSTHISLPYLTAVGAEPRHLEADLTRSEVERLVRPVIERCRGPVDQAIADAGIGLEDIDRVVFVGGPTRMPAVRRFFEGVFVRPAERGVDPMECVASGAAIQAGVLAGGVRDIVLVDVTPLTLGVETLGGVATPLIARNTPIPVKRSETFTTAADMQTSVTVHVYQGERPMAEDNASLGEFTLAGIPPARRSVPKIDVTFDIDADGILSVSAEDRATGKSQSIRITGSTRLSAEEKERMIREAEEYATEDRHRRDRAEKLNAAEGVCYEAERFLADLDDKLRAEVRQPIEEGLKETRAAMAAGDADTAIERSDALNALLEDAGATLYVEPYTETERPTKPHVTEEGEEARPSGSGPRGRVVEAEFSETQANEQPEDHDES